MAIFVVYMTVWKIFFYFVLHHAEKTPWLTHVALFYQVGL